MYRRWRAPVSISISIIDSSTSKIDDDSIKKKGRYTYMSSPPPPRPTRPSFGGGDTTAAASFALFRRRHVVAATTAAGHHLPLRPLKTNSAIFDPRRRRPRCDNDDTTLPSSNARYVVMSSRPSPTSDDAFGRTRTSGGTGDKVSLDSRYVCTMNNN